PAVDRAAGLRGDPEPERRRLRPWSVDNPGAHELEKLSTPVRAWIVDPRDARPPRTGIASCSQDDACAPRERSGPKLTINASGPRLRGLRVPAMTDRSARHGRGAVSGARRGTGAGAHIHAGVPKPLPGPCGGALLRASGRGRMANWRWRLHRATYGPLQRRPGAARSLRSGRSRSPRKALPHRKKRAMFRTFRSATLEQFADSRANRAHWVGVRASKAPQCLLTTTTGMSNSCTGCAAATPPRWTRR